MIKFKCPSRDNTNAIGFNLMVKLACNDIETKYPYLFLRWNQDDKSFCHHLENNFTTSVHHLSQNIFKKIYNSINFKIKSMVNVNICRDII